MRILVHSYVPVHPYRDGAGLRMFHLTPFLTSEHTCDLIQERWPWETQAPSLGPTGYPTDWLERQYRNVWNIHHQPGERLYYGWAWKSPELEKLLDELLMSGYYDVVFSGNDTLPIYLKSKHIKSTPILIGPTDSMHLHYWRGLTRVRSASLCARILIKWPLFVLYQVLLLNRMPYWTMVTERDARNMSRLSPNCKIEVIPYGVDVDWFSKGHNIYNRDPNLVIFLGTLGFNGTNELAIGWFLRNVWPEVIYNCPKARFYIIGRSPSKQLYTIAEKFSNVKIIGYVEDPRRYLCEAGIFVSPMQSGSGIKNKALQAWASRCALVSTSLGMEGIMAAKNGQNVIIADKPSEMSTAIVKLIQEPADQVRLSDNGYSTVKIFYSWETIYRKFDEYLNEIATSKMG